MRIKVRVLEELDTVKLELPDDSNVSALLSKLKLKGRGVIAVRNGEILREEDPLRDGDHVKIFPIAMGG